MFDVFFFCPTTPKSPCIYLFINNTLQVMTTSFITCKLGGNVIVTALLILYWLTYVQRIPKTTVSHLNTTSDNSRWREVTAYRSWRRQLRRVWASTTHSTRSSVKYAKTRSRAARNTGIGTRWASAVPLNAFYSKSKLKTLIFMDI